MFDKIVVAYDQIVEGVQRLIELAVGRPVVMFSGVGYEDPRFMGIYAGVQWDLKDEDE